MKSHLVIFDLDHTLVKANSSYAFGKHLYARHFLSISSMLYAGFCYFRHRCLGLSIQEVHHKIFRRLFKGVLFPDLEKEVACFLDRHLETLWNGEVLKRLQVAKNQGHSVALLSSSPQFLVRPIAERLGISLWVASEYAIDIDHRLCHIAKVIEGKDKALFAEALGRQLGIHPTAMTAYSDSILDLPLLQAVGQVVLVNPDPSLRRLAKKQGWEILHEFSLSNADERGSKKV